MAQSTPKTAASPRSAQVVRSLGRNHSSAPAPKARQERVTTSPVRKHRTAWMRNLAAALRSASAGSATYQASTLRMQVRLRAIQTPPRAVPQTWRTVLRRLMPSISYTDPGPAEA